MGHLVWVKYFNTKVLPKHNKIEVLELLVEYPCVATASIISQYMLACSKFKNIYFLNHDVPKNYYLLGNDLNLAIHNMHRKNNDSSFNLVKFSNH
jgi:hypothetical protein